MDKNGDGKIQFANGAAFAGKPTYTDATGQSGERMLSNAPTAAPAGQAIENELYVDRDIIVLANPEIARLPNWVIALIAAGGLAAALSTAAGLLLVISAAISHDLLGRVIFKDKETGKSKMSEANELMAARGAAVAAILVAGYLGINPPGFVAQVVAFAFGLAAASFFPVIINGIFDKRMNREGAIAGMLVGLIFTFTYIVLNVFVEKNGFIIADIKPTGIGTIGMILHFVVAYFVSRATAAPPQEIQQMVEDIRIPRGAGAAHAH
jgi:cation/acetate symporter